MYEVSYFIEPRDGQPVIPIPPVLKTYLELTQREVIINIILNYKLHYHTIFFFL